MTQSFEEQMKAAFDMIADRLHRDLQAYLAAAADRLSALVEAECAEAASNAARDAAVEAGASSTAVLQQLLEGVGRIERSASLSDTLQALAEAVGQHTDRTSIFLVRGQTLRLWTQIGRQGSELPSEMPLEESSPIAEAARLALPLTTTRDEAGLPPSSLLAARRTTAAVPLTMQGQVVAVVFAERESSDGAADRVGVIAELLARHAARVLESLTATRLTKLGGRAAAPGSSVAGSSALSSM